VAGAGAIDVVTLAAPAENAQRKGAERFHAVGAGGVCHLTAGSWLAPSDFADFLNEARKVIGPAVKQIVPRAAC
jgi:hypothetical protein